MSNRLCLFDFDGTLTSKDSLVDIANFYSGKWKTKRSLAQLSPKLIWNKNKAKNGNSVLKERFLKIHFGHLTYSEFQQIGENYANKRLKEILLDKGMEELKNQLAFGSRVIIVSASFQEWFGPYFKEYDLEIISSKLNFTNGLTIEMNCNGIEKVKQIKSYLDLSVYNEIFVYGNSKGDFPMMELGTKTFYKPFN